MIKIGILIWLIIGIIVCALKMNQSKKIGFPRKITISSLPIIFLGVLGWPLIIKYIYAERKFIRALVQISLACEYLTQAHEHMENGKIDEAGATLFMYAAASGIAKKNLEATMNRTPPDIDGPAAYFPKEPGQSDLDHWYDLCHRAMGLVDEAKAWIIEKGKQGPNSDHYQAYLRLLCASAAVEQMLDAPKVGGPCLFCHKNDSVASKMFLQ